MMHTEQCTKEASSLQSSAYKRQKPAPPHYSSLFYELSSASRSIWDSEVSTPRGGKVSPPTKSATIGGGVPSNMIVIDMRH